jgi:hypothetical protein
MGTDICVTVQIMTPERWDTLQPPTYIRDCKGGGSWQDGEVPVRVWEALHVRNYDTFAMLAGVRNGSGAAGATTGLRFESIAPYRGFPDDFDIPVCQVAECGPLLGPKDAQVGIPREQCMGGCWAATHSASWVLLDELEEYHWQALHTYIGDLTEQQYRAWDHRARPGSYRHIFPNPQIRWSDNGRGLVQGEFVLDEDDNQVHEPCSFLLLSEDEYVARQADADLPVQEFFIRVMWDQTNAECADAFYGTVLPWMRTLGSTDRVRLVFAFDS